MKIKRKNFKRIEKHWIESYILYHWNQVYNSFLKLLVSVKSGSENSLWKITYVTLVPYSLFLISRIQLFSWFILAIYVWKSKLCLHASHNSPADLPVILANEWALHACNSSVYFTRITGLAIYKLLYLSWKLFIAFIGIH